MFERKQLGGSKPSRSGEHDHRPEGRPEPIGERPDLPPGLERSLLPAAQDGIRQVVFSSTLGSAPWGSWELVRVVEGSAAEEVWG